MLNEPPELNRSAQKWCICGTFMSFISIFYLCLHYMSPFCVKLFCKLIDFHPVHSSPPTCSKGYTDVVKIPEGSTHIKVRQYKPKSQAHFTAYLALRRPNGEYLLNGKFMISTSETIIPLNGTMLNYSGWSQHNEALHTTGPEALRESLVVQVLATNPKKPLDIRYSFFLPRKTPLPPRTTLVFSATPAALSSDEVLTMATKVVPTTEPPLTTPPGPRWVTGSWMTCSRTCDTGWQSRTVQCKDPQGKLAKGCHLGDRPSAFKHCLVKKC